MANIMAPSEADSVSFDKATEMSGVGGKADVNFWPLHVCF